MPTPEEKALWTRWLDEVMPPRPGDPRFGLVDEEVIAELPAGSDIAGGRRAAEAAAAELAAIAASKPQRRETGRK